MGTAFMTSKESTTSKIQKEILLNSKALANTTKLTKLFSGKFARGIENKFMKNLENVSEGDIPDYPIQNNLTALMRKQSNVVNR